MKFRLGREKSAHVGKGRHWSPCLALESASQDLKHQEMLKGAQNGTLGLGWLSAVSHKKVICQRVQISRSIRDSALEELLLLVHDMVMQGKWLQWNVDKMESDSLSWFNLLYGYSGSLLKFVMNGVQNTLPSPDNLHRWRKSDFHCGLCGQTNVGLGHIIGGYCKWIVNVERFTPGEDRITWRHNCVLSVISNFLLEFIRGINNSPRINVQTAIRFVRKEDQCLSASMKTKSNTGGLLHNARDWQVFIDLPENVGMSPESYVAGRHLHLPPDIIPTSMFPDIVMISREANVCIIGWS